MNEEKRLGGATGEAARTGKEPADDKQRNNAASRARNRTVMLTPEMTGQVRALLYQDPEEDTPPPLSGRRDPMTELLPPMDWSRPGSAPANAEPAKEAPVRQAIDFNAENEPSEDPRTSRKASTGKLDAHVIQEAVSAPYPSEPEPRPFAPQAPAAPSQVSVNQNAARSGAGVGAGAMYAKRGNAGQMPIVPAPTSKVVGFLISFDKNKFGDIFEVRAGRWLITSRPTDHGEFILIEDETVSPLHAIVRATKEGRIQVLDQLSEFGTGVTRFNESKELEVSGTMVNVDHGDVLRLGERHFVVVTIPVMRDAASKDASDE